MQAYIIGRPALPDKTFPDEISANTPNFLQIYQIDPKPTPNDRPQIAPKPTPNRPKNDPKPTPNRPKIDPKSTPHRPNIYPKSTDLLCGKALSGKVCPPMKYMHIVYRLIC